MNKDYIEFNINKTVETYHEFSFLHQVGRQSSVESSLFKCFFIVTVLVDAFHNVIDAIILFIAGCSYSLLIHLID